MGGACALFDEHQCAPCAGLPFNGALVTGSPSLAWLARDSSKPGRTVPQRGAGEAWVVHASPDWSNERRDAPREQVRGASGYRAGRRRLRCLARPPQWCTHACSEESCLPPPSAAVHPHPTAALPLGRELQVAQELLAEFLAAAGLEGKLSPSDVLHQEAHRWARLAAEALGWGEGAEMGGGAPAWPGKLASSC